MLRSAVTERHPALRSPDFRRLFYNAFFASASHWTMLLARGWLVYDLTDRTAWVGAVTFAGMIQFVIAGPIGGALADRVDRRMLAISANVIAIVAALVLAALTLGDVVEPWHILVLAAVGGLGRAIGMPAEQALMPNLVPRSDLLNAIALSSVTRQGSRVAGPLIGGALLTTLGAGWVFVLSAVFQLFAIQQLLRIAYRQPLSAEQGSERPLSVRGIARDIRAGVDYVEHDPRVAVVLVLVALHCGLTMAFDSMMPTLATAVGGAERTYSGILVGVGAGAIVGSLTVSMLGSDAALGRALAIVGVGSGLAMAVIGLAVSPVMAVTGGVLAGGTQASYMTLSATFVQRIVPDELRGRVMALYVMLAGGHMAFVNFGFGWLADGIGVRVLLIVPGLLWIAAFLAAASFLPEVRALVRRGDFRPRAVAPVPVAVES